jgi:PTS system nitrogen regulatory IIA component
MKALFSVDRMIPRLRARDRRDVLRKLASASVHDAEVSETIVLGAATQAADLPAFGPCDGVALPHAFIPGLRGPLAAVATLSPALDFKAVDGSLTDLVVLLLSPAETASDHLRALARIARRLREPNVQVHLRAAECRESMYVLMVGSDSQADALDMGRRSGVGACDG